MYQLIAIDVDGTLLNSNKQLTSYTKQVLIKALQQGKEIVISSGRCLAEIEDVMKEVPEIRYFIMNSGARVYDRLLKKDIYTCQLDKEYVLQLLDTLSDMDTMIQIMMDSSIFDSKKGRMLENYYMSQYREMFKRTGQYVDNLESWYKENPFDVDKINFYHTSPEQRESSFQRIKDMNICRKYAEITSIECSNTKVNKGTGVIKLCEYLGVDLASTIAIGDADNDTDMLKVAGLSIAMGNAGDSVKEICDVIVEDNDHDGCAKAIEKYMLKKI